MNSQTQNLIITLDRLTRACENPSAILPTDLISENINGVGLLKTRAGNMEIAMVTRVSMLERI